MREILNDLDKLAKAVWDRFDAVEARQYAHGTSMDLALAGLSHRLNDLLIRVERLESPYVVPKSH